MSDGRSPSADLIVEIGTEEMPSGGIPASLAEIRSGIEVRLREARLPARSVSVRATPRRIAVRAEAVPIRQEARSVEVSGPPRSAAYDSAGNPTAAASGFAKAQGVSVRDLTIKKTDKGEYVSVIRKEAADPAQRVLKRLLPEVVLSVGFSKTMRWDASGIRFVRPIRWIVAVHGGRTIPFRLGELSAGDRSWGHRFMGGRPFKVKTWPGYLKDLKRGGVVLDPADRERIIRGGLDRLAKTVRGRWADDPELLSQAVYLTEYPVPMMGRFEDKYLEMPAQIPVTAMKEHQGYFPVFDHGGRLLPRFLFVSNNRSRNSAVIRKGNERVLRARLDDARFYFLQDQKHKLSDLASRLGELVFHEKLGSIGQKTARIGKLGEWLLRQAGRDQGAVVRIREAADLCKADLLTGMVREFPTLQGIMGKEYALREGRDPEMAEAIAEHYFPRASEDPNEPRTVTGKFLTAADRIDTLVGFFGADETPTGSMDPYALRRQGMGLIQIFLDQAFANVSLLEGFRSAANLYAGGSVALKKNADKIVAELETFLKQRMETYLKRRFESTGEYRADLAAALLSGPFDRPVDVYRRYLALVLAARSESFEALMVTFKRVGRIIPEGFTGSVDSALLNQESEKALWSVYEKVAGTVREAMERQDYPSALKELAALRGPADAFFNSVLVMDPDDGIRRNRLALLAAVRDLFGGLADFSRVEVEAPAR